MRSGGEALRGLDPRRTAAIDAISAAVGRRIRAVRVRRPLAVLMEEHLDDRDWLVRFISEHQRSVRLLSNRLRDAFCQKDLLAGRRSRRILREGKTADGLRYAFHGLGCWISDGKLSVDFDFGPEGEVGGFDAWRLHVFSRENPLIAGTRSEHEVQSALEKRIAPLSSSK